MVYTRIVSKRVYRPLSCTCIGFVLYVIRQKHVFFSELTWQKFDMSKWHGNFQLIRILTENPFPYIKHPLYNKIAAGEIENTLANTWQISINNSLIRYELETIEAKGEILLIMIVSNFSFCYNAFKSYLLHRHRKAQSGNGLRFSLLNHSPDEKMSDIINEIVFLFQLCSTLQMSLIFPQMVFLKNK